jgi:hypothetical protein
MNKSIKIYHNNSDIFKGTAISYSLFDIAIDTEFTARMLKQGLQWTVVLWVMTPVPRTNLKMEAINSSETLITTYKTIRRRNPEGHKTFFTAVKTSHLTRITIVKLHCMDWKAQLV